MTFRLENNPSRKILYLTEFNETPRNWYPRVARNAWIDFYSRTVWTRPSEYRENPSSFSLSFLSLSLSDFSSLHCLLPFLFFFSFLLFLPFLIHRTFFSPCLFLSHFSFHFPFFFSFLLILDSPTRMDQVGETSPHFPPWSLVITMFFLLIFFIFPFYYIM